MKNQKGITLIALVVTIIVLLILAGVAIAMLTGDNSILNNAQKASSNNAYSSANDQVRLAYMAVRTQIMAKKVEVSTYDPTLTANMTDLKKIVDDDLKSTDYNVEIVSAGSESSPSATAYLHITYTDNNLLEGSFKNETGKTKEPRQDTNVYYSIEISGKTNSTTPQTARLHSNLDSSFKDGSTQY